MRIALIGMSGTGKSYWSRRLNQIGFACFDCDDRIGRTLAHRLGLADSSIETIGQWMGFPHEAGFADRESHYLELEHRTLARILADLEGQPDRPGPSCVIDTTGSVIYLGHDLLTRLRRAAVVVYLAAAPETRQALLARYRICPRPVIWQGHFRPNPGEDAADALARCYMDLIADRDRRYRRWAHLTVHLPESTATPASPESLLAPVRAYLEENNRAAAP